MIAEEQITIAHHDAMKAKRLVYICDWLPPDFGAVGQYAVLFARQWAREGWAVTLVGLTSGSSNRQAAEPVGDGSLEVLRIHRQTYKKQKFVARLVWTVVSKILLLSAAFRAMRRSDAILFTGSPPLMLHFIAPLNLLLRKHLIYRITDFHPECLIAERGSSGVIFGLLLRLTHFWRRRIDEFEVAAGRMHLKRDFSPVTFKPRVPLPDELRGGCGIILYSGNWGIAHDETTFIEAYAQYLNQSKLGLKFWMKATGAKADRVESEFRSRGLPIYGSSFVPLAELPRLLVAADVHLITLRDPFVGYVLPSKVYACIESGKRILFVGSGNSDIHLVASGALPSSRYCRVDVGDVDGLVNALHAMERAVMTERQAGISQTLRAAPIELNAHLTH